MATKGGHNRLRESLVPYSAPIGVWGSQGERLFRQGERQLLTRQGRHLNPGCGKRVTGGGVGVSNIDKQVSEEEKPVFAEMPSKGDRLNSAVEKDSPLRVTQGREAGQ